MRTACRLIRLQSLARDAGWELAAALWTDSSAAKGLASRRGAGKIRHIYCPALWLQHATNCRQLPIEKRDWANVAAVSHPTCNSNAAIPLLKANLLLPH